VLLGTIESDGADALGNVIENATVGHFGSPITDEA
jgi:hypothetical protein